MELHRLAMKSKGMAQDGGEPWSKAQKGKGYGKEIGNDGRGDREIVPRGT